MIRIRIERAHMATAACFAVVGVTILITPQECLKFVIIGMGVMAALIGLGQWSERQP